MNRPWWWTFTDVELSMIASHLAAGGPFCCKANADARALVTGSKSKRDILAEHAYEAWGCYDGGNEKFTPGNGSSVFAGVGPYLYQNGQEWSEADTERNREYELNRSKRYFAKFLVDIAPRQPLTLERYHALKHQAENSFAVLDALQFVVKENR